MLDIMKVIKFANVIILNQEGKALVLRRTISHQTRPLSLDIPGGGLEPGETFEQAAVRELQEETGLDVLAKDIQLVTQRKQALEERTLEGALFLAKNRITNEAPVILSDEHDRYFWIKPENITGRPEFHQESMRYVLKRNGLIS